MQRYFNKSLIEKLCGNRGCLRDFLIGIFFLTGLADSLFAQNYAALWQGRTKVLEDAYFRVEYPASWVEFSYKSPGVDYVLNITKSGLPAVYNGVPVIAAMYVWRHTAKNDDEIVRYVLEQPNRAGKALISYVENFNGKNVSGKLIVSYFGRYFGKRNGIRYDFVVYSEKRRQYYGFTILIQYVKGQADFAREYNLQSFAEELLNHLILKK